MNGQSQTNEWRKLPNILTMVGLFISLTGNVIQWNQNHHTNEKAEQEAIRADKESNRADELQQQKSDWLNGLKTQLTDTKQQINILTAKMNLLHIQTTLGEDYKAREDAQQAYRQASNELNDLQAKEIDLEKQIAGYMVK